MTVKAKILIVDDLPEKRLVYQSILENLDEGADAAPRGGVELVMADSAVEALKQLLHEDFAVILLDVNMPEMDGFEAAGMIRARKRCAHTPIIFITAYIDDLHVMKGYSYGAVDYILSPVNPDVLRTKVRVFVDLFRKTQEVQEQARALREVQDREHRRQMQESRERLKLALEAGRMGAFEWDLSERLLSWSPTLEAIFGFAPGEFDGSTEQLQACLHPDDRDRILPIMIEAVRMRQEFCIEHRIVRRHCELSNNAGPSANHEGAASNSEVAWVELRGKVMEDPSHESASEAVAALDTSSDQGLRMVGVCMDITQRKLAEAELAKHREMLEVLVNERTAELEASYERLQLADRLASIGTLAAGLGHDMGNLLLPVRARLDSLEKNVETSVVQMNVSSAKELQGGPQALEDIRAIRTACDYLNRLSQGLRLFALDPEKKGASDRTELAKWWPDVESFLRNSLPRPVTLHCAFDAHLPPIAMTPHAFTQAIYNLVQNAGDAMRERGTGKVTIAAEQFQSSESPGKPAMLQVTVSDDGPGMSEEVRQRCMEPFYTTKTRQISTGLGLALVRGSVYNAHGSIEIESTPGLGTTFRILLPIAEAPVRPRRVEGGRACVNLTDVRMRAYVTSLLQRYGMEVSNEAWSPGQAAHILIIESPNGSWNDVEAFLKADAERRAVVFEAPESHAQLLNNQITIISRKPAPAEIRKALQVSLAT